MSSLINPAPHCAYTFHPSRVGRLVLVECGKLTLNVFAMTLNFCVYINSANLRTPNNILALSVSTGLEEAVLQLYDLNAKSIVVYKHC